MTTDPHPSVPPETRVDARAKHRFTLGDTVPPRELTTLQGERIRLPAHAGLTHLQFRRFAACPICHVHLGSLNRRRPELTAAGIRELVVFHSPTADLRPYQGILPFATIADPDQRLYAEFGVGFSLRSVLHPRAWTAPLHPRTWAVAFGGIRAGAPLFSIGGQSMRGLPAEFLFDRDGQVLAAKYARHANDHWSVDELLRQARTCIRE